MMKPAAPPLFSGDNVPHLAEQPQVLIPFNTAEAITLSEAAKISGKSTETMRRWVGLNDLGRHIGGKWAVSKPALLMFLDADRLTLRAYLAGDRSSPAVLSYFTRAGVPT